MASSTPDRVACTHRLASRAGFTLVELIIVISVIAVLVGLLFPMFARARDAANCAKCLSQERQILAAMSLHADTHDGYMPFIGLPHPNGLDPASLQDSQMVRYDYYGTTPATRHVMGVMGALAPILGQHIDATSEATVSASVQTGLVRQLFHCPSNRDQETPAQTVYDGGLEYGSYGFNEAALGWATSLVWDGSGLISTPRAHSRLRGKMTRFVNPSQLCLFTDASPRSDGWLIFCDASANLSLRDYFATTSGPPNNPHASNNPPPGLCANWDLFDTKRHRGTMNVAFADGHVENVAQDQGSLSSVSMNKDFPVLGF